MAAEILVVDDEPDILEFLSYNLEKEGFSVETAENGKQALEKAKKNHPHQKAFTKTAEGFLFFLHKLTNQ